MLQINPRCLVWYTQAANNSSAKWVSPEGEFSLDLQFAEFYIMAFISSCGKPGFEFWSFGIWIWFVSCFDIRVSNLNLKGRPTYLLAQTSNQHTTALQE
jgi:hypothetical protein